MPPRFRQEVGGITADAAYAFAGIRAIGAAGAADAGRRAFEDRSRKASGRI